MNKFEVEKPYTVLENRCTGERLFRAREFFNYKIVTFLRQNMANVILNLVTEVGTSRDLLLSPVR